MSIFCFKKLGLTKRLGDTLRETRESLGIELTEAAQQTQIQKKYLEALEKSCFTHLPQARAYRLAYIREYAAFLKLSEEEIIERFTKEEGFEGTEVVHPRTSIKSIPFPSVSIFLRNIFLAGSVLTFAGYLVWQVHNIVVPPRLVVYTPSEGVISNQLQTVIQGETEKESKLSVNGQDIMVNEQGVFESTIDLSPGLNTITVVATKKHGKTATIVRHLIVKSKQKGDQISLKP